MRKIHSYISASLPLFKCYNYIYVSIFSSCSKQKTNILSISCNDDWQLWFLTRHSGNVHNFQVTQDLIHRHYLCLQSLRFGTSRNKANCPFCTILIIGHLFAFCLVLFANVWGITWRRLPLSYIIRENTKKLSDSVWDSSTVVFVFVSVFW